MPRHIPIWLLGLLGMCLPARADDAKSAAETRQAAMNQCRRLSVAQLGSQHPLAAAAIALIALDVKPPEPLDEPPAATAKPERPANDAALDRDRLFGIEDFTEFPQPEWRDEYQSYLYLIAYARDVPEAELEKAAHKNDNVVTFMHIMNAPSTNRGQAMLIRGNLKRLMKYPAPEPLRGSGITSIYEAWIMRIDPEAREAEVKTAPYPCCVVFTELPSWAKLGENQDVPVAFAGYFFKRLRTDLKFRGKPADAPFFIARTLTRPAPAEEVVVGSSLQFLLMIVGALALLGILAFVIHVWFRREDQAVQTRLQSVRAKRAGPEAAEEAAAADQEHDLTSFRFEEGEPEKPLPP